MSGVDEISAAFTSRPPALPASYEDSATRDRLVAGLMTAGWEREVAEPAAVDALTEAPFVPPDEDGWQYVCARARAWARHHAGRSEP